MQENGASAKQQIIGRIKQSTNILVTVNSNPSVDSLSAALGLALMLNKLDKHATAVFSGAIPPAINFLDPAKTFENNVDSLRDFIVALDKEKADRLRYKVEDDVVKIFITPYRTTITEKDLQFSQGDFNVDLIIALGVEKRDELDAAITAHGRILHDATVVTINADEQKGSLGSIDWKDNKASSLSEMMVALGGALKSDIFDQQISTALLTGVVAATERFSNSKTTSRVMTTAAQLMASGANQQLIANNLQAANTAKAVQPELESSTSGSLKNIPDSSSTKVVEETKKSAPDGEMHISHEESAGDQGPLPSSPVPVPDNVAKDDLNEAISSDIGSNIPQGGEDEKNKKAINASQDRGENKREDSAKPSDNYVRSKPSWMGRNVKPPTLGGTLNATTEEALATKMKQEKDQRNRALFTHGEPVESKEPAPAVLPEPSMAGKPPIADDALQNDASLMDSVKLNTEPTIEQLESEVKSRPDDDLDAARAAVHEAFNAATDQSQSGVLPTPVATPPPAYPTPEVPSIQPEPVAQELQPSPATYQPTEQPKVDTSSLSQLPLPPVPPLPDFNTLPPEPSTPAPISPSPQVQQTQPVVPEPVDSNINSAPPLPQNPQALAQDQQVLQNQSDPGQFRIPGA